jgi:hypothetical protein
VTKNFPHASNACILRSSSVDKAHWTQQALPNSATLQQAQSPSCHELNQRRPELTCKPMPPLMRGT